MRPMIVMVMAATAALCWPPAAKAAEPVEFTGVCELGGQAAFSVPLMSAPADVTVRWRSDKGQGHCIGTLSRGETVLRDGLFPVRARARATGTVSCATGTLAGTGRVVALDDRGRAARDEHGRLVLRTGFSMVHLVQSDPIDFRGADGTSAQGLGSFTPSAFAIGGCATPGVTQLPFTVRLMTSGVISR